MVFNIEFSHAEWLAISDVLYRAAGNGQLEEQEEALIGAVQERVKHQLEKLVREGPPRTPGET